MASRKFHDTTGKPQNVLENEFRMHEKCEALLPHLPDFVGEYFGSLSTKSRSNKTAFAYLNDITKFFEYLVEDDSVTSATKPKEITLADIERLKAKDVDDYLRYIKKYESDDGVVYTNGKAATARKRSSIVGLLTYLYKKDMISHNISDKIDSISIKRTGSENVKVLQEDQVMQLLDIIATGEGLTDKQRDFWKKNKYRDKLILELFLNYGLRITELQQLNLSSFNLKQGEFTIYRKRDKEAVMPMNRSITMVLDEYLTNERNRITNIADGHEDALFLAHRSEKKVVDGQIVYCGRKRLSERQIRDLVKKYTAIVLGNSGYSPHKLRATAATSALHRGNDIFMVANLLDHDSVQTTQRYLQANKEDKRAIVEAMEIELERTQK